jgi:hypothetical protein
LIKVPAFVCAAGRRYPLGISPANRSANSAMQALNAAAISV